MNFPVSATQKQLNFTGTPTIRKMATRISVNQMAPFFQLRPFRLVPSFRSFYPPPPPILLSVICFSLFSVYPNKPEMENTRLKAISLGLDRPSSFPFELFFSFLSRLSLLTPLPPPPVPIQKIKIEMGRKSPSGERGRFELNHAEMASSLFSFFYLFILSFFFFFEFKIVIG